MFFSSRLFCVILWGSNFYGLVESAKIIYVSSANANFSFQSLSSIDIGELFHFEQNVAAVIKSQIQDELSEILSLEVAANHIANNDGLEISTRVTTLYIAEDPMENFSEFLESNVDIEAAAAAMQVSALAISFVPGDITREIATVDEQSSTDSGLVAAIIALSIALLVISAVVFYISGGRDSCQRFWRVLFEDVEEDKEITKGDTFPNENEDELRSVAESSVVGTAANGILGAIGNDEVNPTDGLGIKTPIRDNSTNITGSEFGYDSELGLDTPMSETTSTSANISAVPLGITSMRKLPPSSPCNADDESNQEGLSGGLSRMVLGRY